MGNFKSGIIFKNNIILCNSLNEKHDGILNELKIKDDILNAANYFIRAELFPKNNDIFSNTESWTFKTTEFIQPEWFELNKEKYEKDFRYEVNKWIKNNTIKKESFIILKNNNYKIYNQCYIDTLYLSQNNMIFKNCTISTLEIPEGTTTIKYAAFKDCTDINRIIIPNTVTTIENLSFQNCINIDSLLIPESVICIKELAFYNCIPKVVYLPKNTTLNPIKLFSKKTNISYY